MCLTGRTAANRDFMTISPQVNRTFLTHILDQLIMCLVIISNQIDLDSNPSGANSTCELALTGSWIVIDKSMTYDHVVMSSDMSQNEVGDKNGIQENKSLLRYCNKDDSNIAISGDCLGVVGILPHPLFF